MQRRAHPRKAGVSVIELFRKDGVLAARGSLRNVSCSGLGVAELEPIEGPVLTKGDHVTVRFALADEPVSAEARVQWINDGQAALGLKMTPDEATSAKLAGYVARRALDA
jgi:hypothetical protein